MKKWICTLMLLAVAGAGCAVAENPEAEAPAEDPSIEMLKNWKNYVHGDRAIALVPVGEVDDALVQRVKDYSELQLSMKVDVQDPVSVEEDEDLYGVATRLGENLDASYAMVVAIVNDEGIPEGQTVNVFEKNASAINALALREGIVSEETYDRRIEKLANRAVCLLLGAELVPHAMTCLYYYSTLESLDTMGRGVDPPSLMKVQQEALNRGVAVYYQGPYWLLRNPAE